MADSAGRSILVQGRIVWVHGDLFQGKIKTIFGTQTPVLDQQGNPQKEYGFGLAVPKSALSQTGPGQPGEIWAAMHEEAYTLFPSRQIPPSFAMKYKDGDGVDHNGAPFSQREGYAGHLVFACITQLPIKYFRFENGQNIQINDGIKCGDYVNVQLMVRAHTASSPNGKSGLYLNPQNVQFLGFGKEIVASVNGDQIFGAKPPPLPPGASPTPVAPQEGFFAPGANDPSKLAGSGTYGQFGGAPPPNMAPQGAPPSQQGQTPEPHYGVLPQALQPQQAPQYGAPAMPPQGQPQQPYGAPQMPQPGQPPQQPTGYPQQMPQPQGAPAAPTGMPQPQQGQSYPQNGMPGMPPGYPKR